MATGTIPFQVKMGWVQHHPISVYTACDRLFYRVEEGCVKVAALCLPTGWVAMGTERLST